MYEAVDWAAKSFPTVLSFEHILTSDSLQKMVTSSELDSGRECSTGVYNYDPDDALVFVRGWVALADSHHSS
jgi:hypothetical protein